MDEIKVLTLAKPDRAPEPGFFKMKLSVQIFVGEIGSSTGS